MQDQFVISLLYFFLGIYIVARWWNSSFLKNITFKRIHDDYAFIGDDVDVRLEITNQSWLPVVWMRIHDTIPNTLIGNNSYKGVASIAPRSKIVFDYDLFARKRGKYHIGPVKVVSGDIFGLGINKQAAESINQLVIFPLICNMANFSLPSKSLLGTMRFSKPLLDDPSRAIGKRDYQVGDSLRRIDWKASANTGKVMVKQFEATINLNVIIFLDMNLHDYEFRNRLGSTELAVTIAASFANWICQQKQAFGLLTNGVDSDEKSKAVPYIPPRKGEDQLMVILQTLASVQAFETKPLKISISQNRDKLVWGSTLVIITGAVDDELFDEIFLAMQAGVNPVIVLTGDVVDYRLISQKGMTFGIPVTHVKNTLDLESLRF